MDHKDTKEKTCPQCGKLVEKVTGVAFSSMLPYDGYLCRACKMLYTHDMKPLASII